MNAVTTADKEKQVKQTLFAVVVATGILILVGWLSSQVRLLGDDVHNLAGVFQTQEGEITADVAPGWLVSFENATPTLAYITWGAMAVLVVYLVFLAPKKTKESLVESTSKQDIILGIAASAVLSGLTGYLWAVWNPVPVLPPFIHLRIFAFLIGVWGILIGRGAGFLTGYFGGIVWALVAGYFVITHTPVSDGFFVGLMTGWFISVVVRRGMSRAQLIEYIDQHRVSYYIRCAGAGLIGGLVMSFFVALSLKVTSPLSWWSAFWAIGIISDTLPMVIWIGPISEIVLRLTKRLTWLPNF